MKQKFGENFRDNLLANFSEEQLNDAKRFIQEYLDKDSLDGLTFLDAGCGSGVFTLAAALLRAKVTSFDIDNIAIENTKTLLHEYDLSFDVNLLKGSVLDYDFLTSLGKFDTVLCWGVAHHCGDMWRCIDYMTMLVNKGGKLHLGIYNHADGWGFYPDGRFGPSSFWKKIKRFYIKLPSFFQNMIDIFATIGIIFIYTITLNNPIKKLKSNERRGMNWKSDLKDWLIGYPYEYARPEEVFQFMKEKGFRLEKLKTNNGLLTNNYVFEKI